MFCNRSQLTLAIGTLLSAGIVTNVFAQSSDEAATKATTLDAVTVTGSHIKGAAISGVGPVSVIDEEMIERSGATTVETLLHRLPAATGFAGTQTTDNWEANTTATTQA